MTTETRNPNQIYVRDVLPMHETVYSDYEELAFMFDPNVEWLPWVIKACYGTRDLYVDPDAREHQGVTEETKIDFTDLLFYFTAHVAQYYSEVKDIEFNEQFVLTQADCIANTLSELANCGRFSRSSLDWSKESWEEVYQTWLDENPKQPEDDG